METNAIFRKRSKSRSAQSGKQQESFASAVASFLPDPVYAKLAKGGWRAQGEKFSAAVLFVDVTGFSKLMNDMKSWERWAVWPRALNRFFGSLISRATQMWGAELYKFAGDCLIFFLAHLKLVDF